MQCEICGKECKNVKQHKRLAHPEPAQEEPDIEANPVVIELRQQVAQMVEALEKVKQPGKSVEQIAKILYEDIVKPLCSENNISLGEWEEIDQNDYLKIARKIKG